MEAHDYSNFEKVGPLGHDLPRNDVPLTTQAGDVILYQGNQFVLYYDTNSWNLTPLGTVQNTAPETLRTILGDGDITLTLSRTAPN